MTREGTDKGKNRQRERVDKKEMMDPETRDVEAKMDDGGWRK